MRDSLPGPAALLPAALRRLLRVWVLSERRLHRPRALPLAAAERTALAGFFPDPLLRRIRVLRQPLLGPLQLGGIPLPIDPEGLAAITFVDTIVVAASLVPPGRWLPILFHECVHVAQFRTLGIDRFLREYASGWVRGGLRYRRIPLESQAFALQDRYEFRALPPGAVQEELRRLSSRSALSPGDVPHA